MALEIVIGEEYKIKIESGDKFDESIFKDLYLKASRNVEEIILQSDIENTSELSDDVYNNIIAFTGDRGTGKSSSMISFVEALVNKHKNEHKKFFDNNFEILKAKKIASLPIIDPSLFKGDDKLFEIVVSKMFSKFQNFLNSKNELDHEKKRKLISQFQEVYSNLRIIHEGKQGLYKKEVIEALSELAYGTNLKSSFFELINLYLEFIENEAEFLIIAIDDFDLNISGAFDMLEDIRQFLIQKKVIILISCKINQLIDSLNNEVIKSYDKIINSNASNKFQLSEDLNLKSFKYLDKLIPLERRLNTPILSNFDMYNEELIIKIKNRDKDSQKNQISNSREFQKVFRELVYVKNGHFFSHTNGEINPLIPNNMRNLSNSVSFLFKNDKNEGFKGFLFKEIKDNLPNDLCLFFESLERLPNHLLNQYIANWIGDKTATGNKLRAIENAINENTIKAEIFKKRRRFEDFSPVSSELKNILESSIYYNVSFADINYVFNEIEKNATLSDSISKLFVVYLKNYYSYRVSLSLNRIEEFETILNGRHTLIQEFPFNGLEFFPAEKSLSGKRREEYRILFKPIELKNYLFEKNKIQEFESIELYYWITFFFTFLGSENNSRFRKESTNVMKSSINKKGNQYQSVTFNALAFLSNGLFPDIVLNRFFVEDEASKVKQTQLYNDLKDWRDEMTKPDNVQNYYLFFNLDFFNEFLSELYSLTSESREVFDSFGDRLYNYLPANFELIVNKFRIKYNYLNINFDFIIKNPIIKFWFKNKLEISTILSKLHGLTNSTEISATILIDFFRGKIEGLKKAINTSSTLKRYLNEFKKDNAVNSSNIEIINKLDDYYLKLKKDKENIKIKDELLEFIERLEKNG